MAATLMLVASACGDDDADGSFSWTVHDSMSWGRCVDDALAGGPRTDASVRTAGENCVRYLRPDVATKAASFGGCASSTYGRDESANGVTFAVELEECFGKGHRQGL